MTADSPSTSGTSKPRRGRPRKPADTVIVPDDLVTGLGAAATAATTSTKTTGPGRPTKIATKSATLHDGIEGLYVGLGAMLTAFGAITGQPSAVAVGRALTDNGTQCASALVAWSEQSPKVRRALEAMTTAGGAGIVVAAHAPIIAAMFRPAPPLTSSSSDTGNVETALGIDLATLLSTLTNA